MQTSPTARQADAWQDKRDSVPPHNVQTRGELLDTVDPEAMWRSPLVDAAYLYRSARWALQDIGAEVGRERDILDLVGEADESRAIADGWQEWERPVRARLQEAHVALEWRIACEPDDQVKVEALQTLRGHTTAVLKPIHDIISHFSTTGVRDGQAHCQMRRRGTAPIRSGARSSGCWASPCPPGIAELGEVG